MFTQDAHMQTTNPERASQPLGVIGVPGALLKLPTLGALAGRSRSTLDRDIKAGLLKVKRIGRRCTRVTSEDARAYLERLAGEAA
jgi:hypothetical protein